MNNFSFLTIYLEIRVSFATFGPSIEKYMRKFWILFILLSISTSVYGQQYDLVVAKDGSGRFSTIQEAVNAIRDYKPEGRQRILVKKGVYEEKVIIPSYKTNITLVGEDRDSTILVWHDHAGMRTESGWPTYAIAAERQAQQDGLDKQGKKIGTFQSYTLRVDGLGFECENMTISNDAMTYWNPTWMTDRENRQGVGQAVAVHVEADKVVFRNCRLLGFQDTVFNGNDDSRQIFYRCYIEGTVDFIFGPATCWFEECHLHAIAKGYLTAASTPADHPFGYVFYRCKITTDPSIKAEYLGRPWRNWASVLFYECEMPESIHPQGWHNWGDAAREKTARYAEYGCTGPGADQSQRVSWMRKLSEEEAKQLTVEKVMERESSPWASNFRPVSLDQIVPTFYDAANGKGKAYVGGTLEKYSLPEGTKVEEAQEPLIINLKEVDCTTFVEYVTAAILSRNIPSDSTHSLPLVEGEGLGLGAFSRYVQALRYRQGKRGNYATRKHYFSEWISDNEAQGLVKEVTSSLPQAKSERRAIDFMSTHANLYPQLAAAPALVDEIRKVESQLSQQTLWMVPAAKVAQAYSGLQHGDIVVFVTTRKGLDVFHCGFVWWPDRQGQPRLLHASSTAHQVIISDKPLAEYVQSIKTCAGIRVVRIISKE